MHNILEALNTEQLQFCFPVIAELRPHLSLPQFIAQVNRQQQFGYRLMYVSNGHHAVSAMGYRISEFLGWGKVLYIDDLVTLSSERKKGYAALLLDWAINVARQQHCNQVHLDSGHQRVEAHQLYAKHGFINKSHHFSMVLAPFPTEKI